MERGREVGQRQPEGSDDCPVTRFTYQTGPRAAPSTVVELTKMRFTLAARRGGRRWGILFSYSDNTAARREIKLPFVPRAPGREANGWPQRQFAEFRPAPNQMPNAKAMSVNKTTHQK